jgi:diacylglycerol O-acyltransferase / wax synthase
MEDVIPLGVEDRAILDLECRTIAGHTCKVVRLAPLDDGAPDAARLRERIAKRLALAPALTRRLGGTAHRPGWVADEDFDLAEHVVAAPVSGALDRAGLPALVARLFEQRLDRSRPLWRIDTVALAGGGCAAGAPWAAR